MTMSVGCVVQYHDVHEDLEQQDGWNYTVVNTDVTSRKDCHSKDCRDNSDVMDLGVAEMQLILVYQQIFQVLPFQGGFHFLHVVLPRQIEEGCLNRRALVGSLIYRKNWKAEHIHAFCNEETAHRMRRINLAQQYHRTTSGCLMPLQFLVMLNQKSYCIPF